MKVTFILIVLAALLGFGLIAAAKAASAPEPVAAIQKADEAPPVSGEQSSQDDDPQPTLVFRRICWTGNLRVNDQAGDWHDLACLSPDSSRVNWLEVCGPKPTHKAQVASTLSGYMAVTCWEKIPPGAGDGQ